jgi:formylmethanofuran dehydrogenase subunit E
LQIGNPAEAKAFKRRISLSKKGDSYMHICSYTWEAYVERVRAFHGFAAPGVLIGGCMVDLAYRHLPETGLFDAVCETPKCLPDAIQLLTPCTVGNGWLTIVNLGRYAVTLYDKQTREGIRVFLDPAKVERWSEIKGWFFRLKPKKEQNDQLLLEQIREAGADLCSVQRVTVAGTILQKRHGTGSLVCPGCGESYPVDDGALCLGCQGKAPYVVREGENGDGRSHASQSHMHALRTG